MVGAWEAFRNVSYLKNFIDYTMFANEVLIFSPFLIVFWNVSGCYFQVGNSLRLGMSIPAAYRVALETWASWMENTIDRNKTRVLFRTFEPSHWRLKPKSLALPALLLLFHRWC